ncbi:MAG: U-box domain-containing protein [Chlamydiia bacterium]
MEGETGAYEEASLNTWLTQNPHSPVTRRSVTPDMIKEDIELKVRIANWRMNSGQASARETPVRLLQKFEDS